MRRVVSTALVTALAIVIGAAVVFRADRALRIATGFVSYTLCAEVFGSGLPPAEVGD